MSSERRQISDKMSRRSFLRVAGATAAVVGAGVLIDACSSPEPTYGAVNPEVVKSAVQSVGLTAVKLFENSNFESPTIQTNNTIGEDNKPIKQFWVNYFVYKPTHGPQGNSSLVETQYTVSYGIPLDSYTTINSDPTLKTKEQKWEALSQNIVELQASAYKGNSDTPALSNSMTQDSTGNWTNGSTHYDLPSTTSGDALNQFNSQYLPLDKGKVGVFEFDVNEIISNIKNNVGMTSTQTYP